MAGKIQNAVQALDSENMMSAAANNAAGKSVSVVINSILDTDGYRRRFNELLGARAPQFISSIVSLVNADENLQKAFYEAPITVIQSALKAATFDLPIDPNLGYAYVVPFQNRKKGKMEATFIMGYKGMNQLALRTGAYKKINVIDIREGELKHYDRLTEDIDIQFEEDDELRDTLKIIGWVGYFRLVNGTEKTIYMTKKQIETHEKKFRKGQYMGWGWKDNFNEMAMKTVFRKLIGKWGLMSIDYQKADRATIAAADAIAKGNFDDEDAQAPTQQLSGTVISEAAEIVEDSSAEMFTEAEKAEIIAAEMAEAEREAQYEQA